MTEEARLPKELLTVSVAGMTCNACERRISKALMALPGVVSATASTRKGTASLITTSKVSRASVDKAITGLGYGLGRSPWLSGDPQVWRSAGVAAVFVSVLVIVVGAGDPAGRLGDLSTGGLILVFALGLAAGVSTCMAMVGGVILAISASAAGRAAAKGTQARTSVWRTNLTFQAGRIVGFGLLGAALGTIGKSAAMPQPVVITLMIAVAVLMFLVGVRLTELSPRIAGWSPTIPAAVGDRLGLTADMPSRRTTGTLVAGAATFFLPCGFTQAVQLYAFSTGSPSSAGAIMATFALGTAPALFAVAGAPTLFRGPKKVVMLRALGVIVVGFAVINATSAMRLAGVGFPSGGSEARAISSNVSLTATDQTIKTTQDGDGYHPGEAVIYAGLPTHWVMTSTAAFTCAAAVISQDLGKEFTLKAGPNVVELPKLSAGTYDYTCGMGMYSGRIVVIEPPVTAPATAPAPSPN
ncbi:MAG: sulfite exporter TauE/SafE family protein [Actinomycetota bacterium]